MPLFDQAVCSLASFMMEQVILNDPIEFFKLHRNYADSSAAIETLLCWEGYKTEDSEQVFFFSNC